MLCVLEASLGGGNVGVPRKPDKPTFVVALLVGAVSPRRSDDGFERGATQARLVLVEKCTAAAFAHLRSHRWDVRPCLEHGREVLPCGGVAPFARVDR